MTITQRGNAPHNDNGNILAFVAPTPEPHPEHVCDLQKQIAIDLRYIADRIDRGELVGVAVASVERDIADNEATYGTAWWWAQGNWGNLTASIGRLNRLVVEAGEPDQERPHD